VEASGTIGAKGGNMQYRTLRIKDETLVKKINVESAKREIPAWELLEEMIKTYFRK
jgi:hypothetical protein